MLLVDEWEEVQEWRSRIVGLFEGQRDHWLPSHYNQSKCLLQRQVREPQVKTHAHACTHTHTHHSMLTAEGPHSILCPAGAKKSVGVILPDTLNFKTDAPETMQVCMIPCPSSLSRSLSACLPVSVCLCGVFAFVHA